MLAFLQGSGVEDRPRYVVDLLEQPAATLHFNVQVPDSPVLYRRCAGREIPLALYVLYPADEDNSYPDYAFPYAETADYVFPHMQQSGDPVLASRKRTYYPMIVFSHGYEGHGLWDLHHMKFLASHGYIVVCPCYGDGRWRGEENFTLRPLLLQKTLDYILAHPEFGPLIDRARIGLSGSSFGGYTVLSALGADRLGSIPGQADHRIKAAVVLVPAITHVQSGPFFGANHIGLKQIKSPVLAIYSEDDTVAPASEIERGLTQLGGEALAVMLEGEGHVFSEQAWPIVLTWEVLFFNAHLLEDEAARTRLHEGRCVAGEVGNRKTCL
jgi:predicted dienelactone hydrolase